MSLGRDSSSTWFRAIFFDEKRLYAHGHRPRRFDTMRKVTTAAVAMWFGMTLLSIPCTATSALALIGALQRAGKSFDVQVGPDQGHSALHFSRTMEFFIENLVIGH
jgi:hypothetical protein